MPANVVGHGTQAASAHLGDRGNEPGEGVNLSGKVALVTGASRGIGRGIAEAFGTAGASVAVNYRTGASAAGEVVASIRSSGQDAIAIQADVAEEDDVDRMVATVLDQFGRIDVLVSSAGILTKSHLADMPTGMWDEMMRTNLRSAFLCTRALLPGMLSRQSGSIIYIASQLGLKGAPDLVHYSAAKAALIGMTRALAREVAPHVTVNTIAPGPIETDMLANITEDWKAMKLAELPLARFGRVSDVAPTAVFLASDDAAYYTGQVLGPNGGDVMP
jgi:3-oxoacyl-[acyl-carrier protein] reductase